MLRLRSLTGFPPLALFVALGCSGDGTGPNGNGNGNGTPTLSGSVQPIFTASCALSGCHAGASPQEGMNLSSGQAYDDIVNVPSNQSSLDRVEPGQPDDSYLVHKIQGTQGGTVGGTGEQMPLEGCCLSSAQIATIREWIAAGALEN